MYDCKLSFVVCNYMGEKDFEGRADQGNVVYFCFRRVRSGDIFSLSVRLKWGREFVKPPTDSGILSVQFSKILIYSRNNVNSPFWLVENDRV